MQPQTSSLLLESPGVSTTFTTRIKQFNKPATISNMIEEAFNQVFGWLLTPVMQFFQHFSSGQLSCTG